jgi:glucokinase
VSVLVLALDIGGSSVKHSLVEVVADTPTLVEAFPSVPVASNDFADLRQTILEIVEAASRIQATQSIGISTTGSVDRNGKVLNAGFFRGYQNVSWAELIKDRFANIRTVVSLNDGRASAWAEYSVNLPPVSSHIHAVVGTGIGSGIVRDGALLYGDHDKAGYIGHMKVTVDPTPICSCGSTGCVETVAAAPAIVRTFGGGDTTDPKNAEGLQTVVDQARTGNRAALNAFDTAGRWLGIALGNAMNVLNPSVITVGGGVVLASESIRGEGDGGEFLKAVSDGIRIAAHRRVAENVVIRRAHFGNDGGMMGAALLAASRHSAESRASI